LTFRDLGIDDDICQALESVSITAPFPIQEQAIPLALAGTDVIGQAKTGTGKTFGFGLPILQKLGPNPEHLPRALIVVPTRELALQVTEDLRLAAKNRTTRVVEIYGGKSYEGQLAELTKGADLVVGTPGRLIDLHNQKLIDFTAINYLVLDEADRMLDLGFLPDIEKIFSILPKQKQTLMFSATMPSEILSLTRRYQERPIHIRVSDPDEGKTKADIKQVVYRAHSLDKDEVVGRILQAEGRGKTVIFVKTKRLCSKLADELIERGFKAAPLHGDHRTGRTGRAGKLGVAVTFVDWEDMTRWQNINKELELGIPEPTETYSSSPHLFSDLSIPEGTKGRLKKAKPVLEKPQPAKAELAKPKTRQRRRNYRSGSKPEA